jgi:hypothetical protein
MAVPDEKPLPYRIGDRVVDLDRPGLGEGTVVQTRWAAFWYVDVEFANGRRLGCFGA